MKTRRKSKNVPASSASQEQDLAQSAEEITQNSSFSLAIPADMDLDTLSSLIGDDASLTEITAESVITLYRTLLAQVSRVDAVQRDLEEARADADRKDIELDQALQDRETTSKDLEAALEAAHNEATRAKQERDEVGLYIRPAFDVFPLTKFISRYQNTAGGSDSVAYDVQVVILERNGGLEAPFIRR
jgi:nucleoprotein TPR